MKTPDRFLKRMMSLLLGLLILTPGQTVTAEEEGEEILEKRDFFTKTFDNLDGTETLHAGLEPLHYLPPGAPPVGEMHLDIDPSLIEEEGWRNDTNSFPSRLPEMLGDGAAIELGPELGIRWQPGPLFARTTDGEDVELGLPAPSWGVLSENLDNAVIYTDLYPGLDLQVEVRPGSLALVTRFREWLFELAPEQIDFLYIEAPLEVEPALLEAVDQRAAAGEAFEEIPLYFGGGEDEYVITLAGHPGIPDAHLEEHSAALFKDDEGGWQPGPEGWRSNTADYLAQGTMRHFFRHPLTTTLEYYSGVGTTSSALTAKFEISHRTGAQKTRFFDTTYTANGFEHESGRAFAASFRCPAAFNGNCRNFFNVLTVGKEADSFFRAIVSFTNLFALRAELLADPKIEVTDVRLGFFGASKGSPFTGYTGFSTDEILAYRAVPALSQPGRLGKITIRKMPTVFSDPYNETSRSVPGGSIKTSTWSPLAPGSTTRNINGTSFQMGNLPLKGPGDNYSRAVTDFHHLVVGRNLGMTFLLAMPFDASPCTLCTTHHPDPAVQALNGDYRVGALFGKMRLEVTTRKTTSSRVAGLTATSVGSHNDQLYPGETRSWDVELTSLSGTPDILELNIRQWSAANGVHAWFTDSSGQTVTRPPLAAVGDKVRVNVRWDRADPTLYGKVKKLEIKGWFRTAATFGGGSVEIPILLKAPEGQPTFSQTSPVYDDNVAAPMGFADIQLPSQGLEGAVYSSAMLDWVSGPTQKLVQGQHWDVWSNAFPNNDGEIVIYPDQFKPGTYKVNLTPCLWPDGMISSLHCLPGQKQQITFDMRVGVPSTPANKKPVIDFISPWSIDSPSGGKVTISAFGRDLKGTDPATKVRIPQLLAQTTPEAGSTDTRVSVKVQTASTQVCGPRDLNVITTDGIGAAVFNVTKPFSSGTYHFAVEAEAGIPSSQSMVRSISNASNGKAIGRTTTGAIRKLTIPFQVPSTANYQIHALYLTPKQANARAKVTVSVEDPATGNFTVDKSFESSFSTTTGGQFRLSPLRDVGQVGGTSVFNLVAGKNYRLELDTLGGWNFPILDLLVFSDGNLGPKLAEICR